MTGETKTVQTDSGQTSTSATTQEAQDGTTSQAQPTFTQEDLEKAKAKAISDALAAAGRTAKALEEKEKRIKAEQEKLANAERERELQELESARDNPETLSLIQRKQKLAAEIRAFNAKQDEFNRKQAEFESQFAEVQATRFEASVASIASKYGVKADTLKDLGITDINVLDKVASQMKPVAEIKPDSGKTVGGGRTFSREQIAKMTDAEYKENREAIIKPQAEDRIK